jgi:hypothetical protein
VLTFRQRSFLSAAIALLVPLVQPAPAHAGSLLVLNSGISASLMMLINPNLCITYAYDINGNRTAQTNVTYGTPGATWGSAVYACFNWTSP